MKRKKKADAKVTQVGDRSFVLSANDARILAEDLLAAATTAVRGVRCEHDMAEVQVFFVEGRLPDTWTNRVRMNHGAPPETWRPPKGWGGSLAVDVY